jgi:hypothetical protein
MRSRRSSAHLFALRALALSCLAGTPLALAQVSGPTPLPAEGQNETRPTIQIPISLSRLDRLHVTPRGVRPPVDSDFGLAACNFTSSHTDANFSGGNFVVQAGFAQQEMFAATYTLAATEFPIKHNLTEIIVATSGTIQQTTTRWSILIWEGEPNTGNLIFSASSDGDLLPHIVIPAGTNGVNLQFSVDPGDPDQIIINDNGTHKFSVAFRIDRHHNQTQNPCFFAPPSNSNAFPCTDTSGLSQPSANWLFGVNCGSFGCPPNGGWMRFSGLASGCRPSGDWVSRTTWSSVACQPGIGACCLPNGNCVVTTSGDCSTQGGVFQGDFTDCSTVSCPQPTGACCFSTGFCISNLTQAQCSGAGGTFQGVGSQCNSNSTCPTGACCLPDGTCITATPAQCQAQDGTYRGNNTSCSNANCPQPTGGCCFPTGGCLALRQDQCIGAGGTWGGPGTNCADNNGNGRPDLCEPTCRADFNQDGTLDFFDYLDFVAAFSNNSPSADYNIDSVVDFFDYLDFVADFSAGC